MINNQSTVAGNFLVAPNTKNNDGKFNVLIFKHKDNLSLAKAIISLSLGRFPKNDENLISFETREVTINSVDKSNLSFFGDGESFRPSPIITAKIEAASLDIHCVSGKRPAPNSYSLDQVGYL
jgi:diacylglycerol kinase family enzyme